MAADRKKIIDGLREMQRACGTYNSCLVCEITDICTRVDEAITNDEIDPSKIKLPEE